MTAATLLPLSRPLYVHGTPNWVDLHTTDTTEAMRFYRHLFGWTFHKRFSLSPIPGSAVEADDSVHVSYIAGASNAMVAEVVEKQFRFEDSGWLPSASTWSPHISVVDLDATLRRVEAAGGAVVQPPTERGSLATTAVIADPSGAILSLWQAADMAGVGAMGSPGTLGWLELETDDIELAAEFYGEIFGWTSNTTPLVNHYFDHIEDSRGDYNVFGTALGLVAGAVRPILPGVSPSWCPAFRVDDVDVATMRAVGLGGVVMAEPYDIPSGRQAVLLDSTGAAFGLLGPKTQSRRL